MTPGEGSEAKSQHDWVKNHDTPPLTAAPQRSG